MYICVHIIRRLSLQKVVSYTLCGKNLPITGGTHNTPIGVVTVTVTPRQTMSMRQTDGESRLISPESERTHISFLS